MSQDAYINTPSGGQVQLATMEAVSNMGVGTGAAPLGGKLVWTGSISMVSTSTTVMPTSADYIVLRVIGASLLYPKFGSNSNGGLSAGSESIVQQKHTDDVIVLKNCTASVINHRPYGAIYASSIYSNTSKNDFYYSDSWWDYNVNHVPGVVELDTTGTTITVKTSCSCTHINIEAYSYT